LEVFSSARLQSHLSDFLQVANLGGGVDAEEYSARFQALTGVLEESGAKFETVNEATDGQLSFRDDSGARIVMPLLQPGSSGSTDLEDIAYCFQLLGKLNTDIDLSLTTGTAGSKCEFQIQQKHLEKLPLLLDLMDMHHKDDSYGASKQSGASRGPPRKRQCKSTPILATDNVRTLPFHPPQPASAAGLACLLLLQENTAPPLQIFGSSSCGPRLAVQCLSVRSTSCCAFSWHAMCAITSPSTDVTSRQAKSLFLWPVEYVAVPACCVSLFL
jgi:hypothetical protein